MEDLARKDLERILKDKKLHKKFYKAFVKAVEDNDEIIIGVMAPVNVINIFLIQGYWAGVSKYLFYRGNMQFNSAPRHFGRC